MSFGCLLFYLFREDKEYSFVVEGVSHDELQVKAVELDTKKNVAVKVGPVKQRAGKNGKSSEDEEKGEDGTIKPKGKRCKVSLKPTHAGIVSLSGYVENTLIGDAQLVVIKPKPKATIESALPGEAFVGHPASFKLNTNTVESDQLDAIEIKVCSPIRLPVLSIRFRMKRARKFSLTQLTKMELSPLLLLPTVS